MKKFIVLTALLALPLAFTGCNSTDEPTAVSTVVDAIETAAETLVHDIEAAAEEAASEAEALADEVTTAIEEHIHHESEYVTVTYFDATGTGHDVTVRQNPTSVAIFDWGILDILYTVGWEKTGIETLVIADTATLPNEVAWFGTQNFVVRGGTLHYVNFDILDLVQPELVILGTRSFAHNHAGETTSPEVRAELRAQAEAEYQNTAFIRLTQNASRSNLINDLRHNVSVLQQIFPHIADDLQAHLDASLAQLDYVRSMVETSDSTALFVMVWADRMSIFLPEGRFHMIYDEFGFTSAAEELPQWTDQHGLDARTEFLLSADPDVIFLLDRTDMASPTGGVGVQNFLADTIIQNTSAFQNDHIYVLEGNAWYTVTGGLSALDTMIANIMEYVNTLE